MSMPFAYAGAPLSHLIYKMPWPHGAPRRASRPCASVVGVRGRASKQLASPSLSPCHEGVAPCVAARRPPCARSPRAGAAWPRNRTSAGCCFPARRWRICPRVPVSEPPGPPGGRVEANHTRSCMNGAYRVQEEARLCALDCRIKRRNGKHVLAQRRMAPPQRPPAACLRRGVCNAWLLRRAQVRYHQ